MITLTPLKQIQTPNGHVLHALKSSEKEFTHFGEAYFSAVDKGAIKGWKKHHKMISNIVVPFGSIRFICYDGQDFNEIILNQQNYQRLTISPGIWFAFQGLDENNMLLNIASIEHDPSEAETCPLNEISYEW